MLWVSRSGVEVQFWVVVHWGNHQNWHLKLLNSAVTRFQPAGVKAGRRMLKFSEAYISPPLVLYSHLIIRCYVFCFTGVKSVWMITNIHAEKTETVRSRKKVIWIVFFAITATTVFQKVSICSSLSALFLLLPCQYQSLQLSSPLTVYSWLACGPGSGIDCYCCCGCSAGLFPQALPSVPAQSKHVCVTAADVMAQKPLKAASLGNPEAVSKQLSFCCSSSC